MKTNKKLDIKKVKDCWGSVSYVGYKNGQRYTEIYDSIDELKEQNYEFESLEILSKNDWEKIHNDYKGEYIGEKEELKGLKTKMNNKEGRTILEFEGIHFIIL